MSDDVTMRPFVVVLSDADITALRELAAEVPIEPFRELFDRNGWSMDMLVGGKLISEAVKS